MATKQAWEPSAELDESNLKDLCEALYPVSTKYKFVGLTIGVLKSEIDIIEAQYRDPVECLLEILSVRLKQTPALTWGEVDEALRSCLLREKEESEYQCKSLAISSEESEKRGKKKHNTESQPHSTQAGKCKNTDLQASDNLEYGEPDPNDRSEEQDSNNSETELDSESSAVSSKEQVNKRRGRKNVLSAPSKSHFHGCKNTVNSRRDKKKLDIKPRKYGLTGLKVRDSSSCSTSDEDQPLKRQKPKNKYDMVKTRKTVRKQISSVSTNTDESSPECSINLSDSESKNVRKVYKRFFGRLCLVLKNPTEIAAEFQIRCLISYSVMHELLISPESQQSKAITLVTALQKRIETHPEIIFAIIEVLMQNEILQQTGREMLTEAGKINYCLDLLY